MASTSQQSFIVKLRLRCGTASIIVSNIYVIVIERTECAATNTKSVDYRSVDLTGEPKLAPRHPKINLAV